MLAITLTPTGIGEEAIPLVLPTKELISRIQERHPWFTGLEITCKHGLEAVKGLVLITTSQLTSLKLSMTSSWSLTLADDLVKSLVTDATPKLSGAQSVDEFVEIGGLFVDKWLCALHSTEADDVVWFLWLARRAPSVYNDSDAKFWNATHPLTNTVLVTGDARATNEIMNEVIDSDLGYTSFDWSSGLSWHQDTSSSEWRYWLPDLQMNSARAVEFCEHLAREVQGVYCLSWDGTEVYLASMGHGYEYSYDAGKTEVITDYWTYYVTTHQLIVSGRTNQTGVHTINPWPNKVYVTFKWAEARGSDFKTITYDVSDGKPAEFGSGKNPHFMLPWYAMGTPSEGGTPDNDADLAAIAGFMAASYYKRFVPRAYEQTYAAWLYFPVCTQWDKIVYRLGISGASTEVSYKQFLPDPREASSDFMIGPGYAHNRGHADGRITIVGSQPAMCFRAKEKWTVISGGDEDGAHVVNCYRVPDPYTTSVPSEWSDLGTFVVYIPRGYASSGDNYYGKMTNVQEGDIMLAYYDGNGRLVATDAFSDAPFKTIRWIRNAYAYLWDGTNGWQFCDGAAISNYGNYPGCPAVVGDLRSEFIQGQDKRTVAAGASPGAAGIGKDGTYPGFYYHGQSGNNHPAHVDHVHEEGGTGAVGGDKAGGGFTSTEKDAITHADIDLEHDGIYDTSDDANGWTDGVNHNEGDTDNRPPFYNLCAIERVP